MTASEDPLLVIDGDVKIVGRVESPEEIERLLLGAERG